MSNANERPILFSAPMVRAILEGRKATQTRRIVKSQPDDNGLSFMAHAPIDWREDVHGEWEQWKGETPTGDTWRGSTPYYPGLRLWVRETHLIRGAGTVVDYRADFDPLDAAGHGALYGGWKPSIHMPRRASRITLAVTGVRVERLNDISEEDAKAEGVTLDFKHRGMGCTCGRYRCRFAALWESINGVGSWDANPWVWVIEFQTLDQ